MTEVQVLTPDPLFRGVEGARHLNEFIGSRWPDIIQLEINEWSVFSLLLQTHVARFWSVPVPGWNSLPAIAAIADNLVGNGELLERAGAHTDVDEVAEALWDRLGRCLPEVAELADDDLRS